MVVIGLRGCWPFLAQISRLSGRLGDRSCKNDVDGGMVGPNPPGERKAAPSGSIHVSENDIDGYTSIRKELPRLIGVSRLQHPITTFPQIFGKRMPDKQVRFNDRDTDQCSQG
jgi:hypothetical protein